MADKLTPEQRSSLMSRIRSKNTKPEIAVRRFLHARGFRFRLHDKKLPGTPDIVLPKYRTAIFVNGCLWHGHFWCARYRMPKSNREYWSHKIRANKRRDKEKASELKKVGWKVITVWECEVYKHQILTARLQSLLSIYEGTYGFQKWLRTFFDCFFTVWHSLACISKKLRRSVYSFFSIKSKG